MVWCGATWQEVVEAISPAITLQLMGPVLLRIADLFERYVRLMGRALPESEDANEADEVASRASEVGPVLVSKAVEESQQLALLGNATSLADVLLPRLAARLATPPSEDLEEEESGGRRLMTDLEILRYVRYSSTKSTPHSSPPPTSPIPPPGTTMSRGSGLGGCRGQWTP